MFDLYAKYYDLLYADKDYSAEVDYVLSLVERFSKVKVRSILDLGCGTGRHAAVLADKGYEVFGIDLSEKMIEIAKQQKKPNLQFEVGDVRNLNLNRQFDLVISLFHVASYQMSNEDFLAYLQTAYKHLRPGGLFIFDFWYGPGVFFQKPKVRVKRFENSELRVTRIAEPKWKTDKNLVIVNFEILIENKRTGQVTRIYEQHPMRYFFLPELKLIADKIGFSSVATLEWLTFKHPKSDTWNVINVWTK